MPTVYHYPACGTCRRALAFLKARGVAVEARDIVKTPPDAAALGAWIARSGLPIRRFFNTSGESYRQGNWKDRIEAAPAADLLAALAADGKLIKRPLLITDSAVLVGFDEEAWSAHFPGSTP